MAVGALKGVRVVTAGAGGVGGALGLPAGCAAPGRAGCGGAVAGGVVDAVGVRVGHDRSDGLRKVAMEGGRYLAGVIEIQLKRWMLVGKQKAADGMYRRLF